MMMLRNLAPLLFLVLLCILSQQAKSFSSLFAQIHRQASGKHDTSLFLSLNNDNWSVANQNGSISLQNVAVPGIIHSQLRNAGIIGDPYYRYNDVEYRWIAKDHWTYSYTFTSREMEEVHRLYSSDSLDVSNIFLVCEGLDTITDIFVNGKQVAHTDNMFRRYMI